jgi:phosphoribosylformylglycinamidine cyclo-ligase
MRYRDAGVDLGAQEQAHRAAAALLGGQAGAYNRWIQISGDVALHVDGVGTKTVWLIEADRVETIGWDCLYVNINDLACDGFKPVAAVDYVSVEPSLEGLVPRVLKGLGEAASKAGVAILGGETAIMPGVVKGLDAACAVMGVRAASTRPAAPGDYIIGLESTGPHANGFSLLRKIYRLGEKVCGSAVEEALLAPVADYSPVLNLMRDGLAKAAAHVTGGSFKKLKRVLGPLGAEIELGGIPCWAEDVIKRGVPPDEAYRVFNMGIGMAVFTDAPRDALRELDKYGLRGRIIGRVKPEGPLLVDGVVF